VCLCVRLCVLLQTCSPYDLRVKRKMFSGFTFLLFTANALGALGNTPVPRTVNTRTGNQQSANHQVGLASVCACVLCVRVSVWFWMCIRN
jgi:hypothetical protein